METLIHQGLPVAIRDSRRNYNQIVKFGTMMKWIGKHEDLKVQVTLVISPVALFTADNRGKKTMTMVSSHLIEIMCIKISTTAFSTCNKNFINLL